MNIITKIIGLSLMVVTGIVGVESWTLGVNPLLFIPVLAIPGLLGLFFTIATVKIVGVDSIGKIIK